MKQDLIWRYILYNFEWIWFHSKTSFHLVLVKFKQLAKIGVCETLWLTKHSQHDVCIFKSVHGTLWYNTTYIFFEFLASPAHLVLALSGGPGAPVPPSRGRVSRTLISYSVSGSRWPILCVVLSTGCRSYIVPDTVRYSTSRSMIGPSPLMLLAFSWIHR